MAEEKTIDEIKEEIDSQVQSIPDTQTLAVDTDTLQVPEDENEVGLIIDEDDIPEEDKIVDTRNLPKEKEYKGPGIVLDAPVGGTSKNEKKGVVVGPLANDERLGDVEKTINEFDSEIEKQRKLAEERIASGEVPKREINDPNAPDAVREKNRQLRDGEAEAAEKTEDEAKKSSDSDSIEIIIDKAGLGSFEFTEEEKARIEKAKRIKLVEVETKSLETIRIKKKLKGNNKKEFSVLKRNFDKSYSNVVATASGFTCKMKNLSAAEAIRMYQRPGEDTANSILDKWSVIYDKMINCSIGDFKSFEDFTKRTAFMDYEAFLYGLICSSYPEEDTISFTCDKEQGGCGKDFTINYNNRQMIRQSLITEATKNNIAEIVNASSFVDKAKKLAEESAVNNVKRVKIDESSGIIVELYVPSVHEMVERVFRRMQNDRELTNVENRELVVVAQSIKSIFIPDYEDESDDVEYFQVDDLVDIVDVLRMLNEQQLQIVARRIQDFTSDLVIRFGFDSIKCSNCGRDWGSYTMDLDQILFQRVQQRATTEIE